MASDTCMANSRVGTSTSARGVRPDPIAVMVCNSGSANAAVLPVPVAALPSRSRPSIRGGMASC